MDTETIQKIGELVGDAKSVVIVQADNPDGDSLASALALETILHELGREPIMYCGIEMPENLKYLPGWDRVSPHMPAHYDLAIMVDCAFLNLLDQLQKNGEFGWFKSRPLIVLDHHGSETDIDFATVMVNNGSYVATGELIFELGKQLQWPISEQAAWFLAASILADTLGLSITSLDKNPRPFHIMGELVEKGASVADIQEARLVRLKYPVDVLRYRAKLLERIEFFDNNQIATVSIPYNELNQYSHVYNPTVILDEMRNVEGVRVGIGFKLYDVGGVLRRVTARIRCTRGNAIADKLAEHFGGGGHPMAAGFKVEKDRIDFESLKSEVIQKATELLGKASNETT